MVWVFGYGSLVWKTGFPYRRRLVGHVKGMTRRFWWWSLDHRGVPGAPGRVVNLLASDNPESRVWGVAYEIPDEQWEGGVREHLDHREKGGYKQQKTLFHPKESGESPIEVTLYLGPKDDKQYAGPAPLEEMALTILKSVSLIELTPFREMFRVVRQNSVNHKKFRLVPAARTKNISTTWPMHFATLIKMMIISTN